MNALRHFFGRPGAKPLELECRRWHTRPTSIDIQGCRRHGGSVAWDSGSRYRSCESRPWRRILHINVTAHPYAEWAAQQVVEAARFDTSISRLIRDRDGIYGANFGARVDHLGIQQFRTSPRAPWQNGCAERWVGTLRREVLDHIIVLGERHLLWLVQEHARYYNEDRPHMTLDGDAPVSRAVELPSRPDSNRSPYPGSSQGKALQAGPL